MPIAYSNLKLSTESLRNSPKKMEIASPVSLTPTSPTAKFKLWSDTKMAGSQILRKTSNASTKGFPTPFEVIGSSNQVIAESDDEDSGANETTRTLGQTSDEESVDKQSAGNFRADGGKHAWLFLLGASIVEGLMWGFPLTYGLFLSHYQSHPPFQDNPHLTMVGTLTTGISYLGTVLVTPLTIKYPKFQRHMIFAGWLVCVLSLIAGSFSSQLWHLILTQGVAYGFGFLVIYYPILSMINDWFIKRRGFAYGTMFGSASLFGLILPFIVEKGLDRYGYATTLRAFGVGIFVLVGPTLPLLKPRSPPSTVERAETKFHWATLRRVNFTAISFSNSLQGLVYFLPGIFLPSYATALGLSKTHGSLILALINLAQVFGCITTGVMADNRTPYLPMTLSTVLSALIVSLLWGFSSSLPPLLIFALLYGFLAGGYSVLYCRFVTMLSSDRATGLWLFCIFECQRGIGNILGGYLAGLLVDEEVKVTGYGLGEYTRVIVFVGVSMLLASFGSIGWWWRDKEWKNLSK